METRRDNNARDLPGYMQMTTSALLKRRSRKHENLRSSSLAGRRLRGAVSRKFLGRFVITEKVKAAKAQAKAREMSSAAKPGRPAKEKKSKPKVSRGRSFSYASLRGLLKRRGVDGKIEDASVSARGLEHLPSIPETPFDAVDAGAPPLGENPGEAAGADSINGDIKPHNREESGLQWRRWSMGDEDGHHHHEPDTFSEPAHSFGRVEWDVSDETANRPERKLPNKLGEPSFLELVTPCDKTGVDCDVDPIDPIIRYFNKVLNISRIRKNKKGKNVIGKWMSSSGKWKRIAMVVEDGDE